MYRYPANPSQLIEARAYALASLDHTFDYDGFKDGHKKMGRIFTGKYAQLWLCEFCRLNEIPHKKDTSSPMISDDEDLSICGYSIDCKVSVIDGMWPQVTTISDTSGADVYFFFRCDERLDYIQPIGAIGKPRFLSERVEITKGFDIPGTTKIKQRFSKSYFIDPLKLESFSSSVQLLMKSPR